MIRHSLGSTNPGAPVTPPALPVAVRSRRSDNRPPWMEPPSPLMTIAKVLVLIGLVVVMLFPFVNVIAVSFSSYRDVIGGRLILFPAHPTLDAYRAIFQGNIVAKALQVSAGITLIGTLAQMIFTTTMAYGLSRSGMPGGRVILFLVLGALLFSPGIIPSYLLIKELGLLNTYPALVLPGLISAFNLVIVRQFFMNLPEELLASARIDGASDWQVFWQIVLPLSKAVLAVVALFYAVGLWNSFFNAVLYLSDESMWPIQLVLRQYVLQGSTLAQAGQLDPGQQAPPPQTIQMAIVVLATAPILVVYPFLQKYFTKGVLTGALKG